MRFCVQHFHATSCISAQRASVLTDAPTAAPTSSPTTTAEASTISIAGTEWDGEFQRALDLETGALTQVTFCPA
jgi:hypothetical protein